MFGLFKKGFEYNKLAIALNNSIQIAEQLQRQYDNTFNSNAIRPALYELAFQYKVEVTDRLLKYNWPLNSVIFLNGLNSKMTLAQAIMITTEKIKNISEWCLVDEEIIDIMSGGELYYKYKK